MLKFAYVNAALSRWAHSREQILVSFFLSQNCDLRSILCTSFSLELCPTFEILLSLSTIPQGRAHQIFRLALMHINLRKG